MVEDESGEDFDGFAVLLVTGETVVGASVGMEVSGLVGMWRMKVVCFDFPHLCLIISSFFCPKGSLPGSNFVVAFVAGKMSRKVGFGE